MSGWPILFAISMLPSLMVNGAPLPAPIPVAISSDTSPSFPTPTVQAVNASETWHTSSRWAPNSVWPSALIAAASTTVTSSTTLTSTDVQDHRPAAAATILAFHNLEGHADAVAAQHGNRNAQSQDASQFWVSYNDPWSSSDTALEVSLPNLTAVRGDSIKDFHSQALTHDRRPQAGNSSLSYKIYFPEIFDFGLDAHLPSIYSGRLGCGSCFSSRVRYTSDGRGELYIYTPFVRQSTAVCSITPSSVCDGPNLHIGRGSFKFARNRWITIRQDLWLNHPGQDDGGFNIWVDGRLALHSDNVQFINTAQTCPLQTLGLNNRPGDLYDACLPPAQSHWTYRPLVRKPPNIRTRPTLSKETTTVTLVRPTTVNVPVTKTVVQSTTVATTRIVTHTAQVTVSTTETITLPITETATVTVTEVPEPTEEPPELPIIEPPSDEQSPAEEEPPEEEEALDAEWTVFSTDRGQSGRRALQYSRDDGMWKGISGYPGDPGYRGGPGPLGSGQGAPFTFSWTQIVTLPGAVQTVTVTQAKTVTTTIAAKPTPPVKKPAPKKKPQ